MFCNQQYYYQLLLEKTVLTHEIQTLFFQTKMIHYFQYSNAASDFDDSKSLLDMTKLPISLPLCFLGISLRKPVTIRCCLIARLTELAHCSLQHIKSNMNIPTSSQKKHAITVKSKCKCSVT